MVGEAALAGDRDAVAAVRELGRHLGHACGMVMDLLNPERISLGSMAVRLGDLLLDEVRAGAKEEALPMAFENCEIGAAVLGDRVQDCAALAVAVGVGGET
jgi:predicted NBD/HSP70 family sugar kinase